MDISTLLSDKSLKPKEKTEALSRLLLGRKISCTDLVSFCARAKDPAIATCIEAIEFASRKEAELVDAKVFAFVTGMLGAKAPRIKWESAKVIGNTARLHLKKLDEAIAALLVNTEHEGTVVRWSAAFALGEIFKLKTKHQPDLKEVFESICRREEKNSIRKIYQAAVKTVK